jgi:uncharacterized RDD family membrane protein YckC
MNDVFVPSTWRRLFAKGIDQIVRGVFYIPFVGLLIKLFTTSEEVKVSLSKLMIVFFIPPIYELIFLILFQATPGKWLMGLKVVPFSSPETKLDLGQCLLRSIGGQFTFFFSWAIYAVAFFRYDRTHVVDWIAQTRVIQVSPRLGRAKLRPLMGFVFIVFYAWEGLVSAHQIIHNIDWMNGQADLRVLTEIESLNEILEHTDFED